MSRGELLHLVTIDRTEINCMRIMIVDILWELISPDRTVRCKVRIQRIHVGSQ